MKAKPQVSLRAIAEKVGVTTMTVSNALNDKGRMSDEKRKNIQSVAHNMGYRPNLQARGMQTGKSRVIGVMVPAMGFYGPMVQGIHDGLDQHGYNMLLTWPSGDMADSNQTEEHDKINKLIALRVDGIITRATFDKADEHYFKESLNMGIPIVAVDRRLARFDCLFSGTNDRKIGSDAAKRLLELGHRRLAIAIFKQNVSVWKLRMEGFKEAIKEFGKKASLQIIEVAPPESPELILPTLNKALSAKKRPTAIFAVNDDLAELTYQVARKNKLSIPRDLSIIGCGNQENSRVLRPQLSSFDQQPYEIGQAAVEMLINSLTNPNKKPSGMLRLINAELINRKSCAAPSAP